jgi:hypothetical protein
VSGEEPTRPESLETLGFERRPMVRWLDPFELIQTGLRTAISMVFGEFADKREMQEALAKGVVDDPDQGYGEDLWLDFVADSGDGFDSTYTIAYLLAQAELVLDNPQRQRLPRGQLLVMGGDQVYPTPSRHGYENRLIGPYKAALPGADDPPLLYAIPGNHDWYDGLTNFLRFFCSGQNIGGWLTKQKRSYFAVKLTHNWWLWGIDIQFDAYIDEPQLGYFDRAAGRLQGGERVLLVTGKPSWTNATPNSPSYENLRFLEERIIETGGRNRKTPPKPEPTVPVMLTGDDHHYARYAREDGGQQKITAGGGGAFLSATHHLRDRVTLPRGFKAPSPPIDYYLKKRYPSLWESRLIGLATLGLLPLRNWRFIVAVFFAYLIPALLLQTTTHQVAADEMATFGDFLGAIFWTEWLAYAAGVLFVFLFLYAAVERPFVRIVVAGMHALAHVLLLAFFVACSAFLFHEFGWSGDQHDSLRDLIVATLGALFAAPPGAVLVAAYLVFMDAISRSGRAFPRHTTELFAAQQRTSYKNFLRIHISGKTGTMTIYPIGVRRAASFEFRTNGAGTEPYFKPTKPIEWALVEEPIVVGGDPLSFDKLSGESVE